MSKTISQLFEEFIEECRYAEKLREETLRGYRACFTLLLKIYPDLELADLTPPKMIDFFRTLEKRERRVGRGKIKKGIKNSTVATYRSKLNKFFDWLRERGHISNGPFSGIPYPEVIYSKREFIPKESIESIFNAVSFNIKWKNTLIKRRNLAILSVLLNCGIRKGELIGIHLVDIDLDKKELRVRAESSKSKRDRWIPLNQKVLVALKEYLVERRKGRYTTPYLWVVSGEDKRFTMHGFKHFIALVVRESGVKFNPHKFRHTFAINLLNSGTDIFKLRQLLGHSDINMTCAYLRGLPNRAMLDDVNRITFDNLL